jgi:hypothetical protein
MNCASDARCTELATLARRDVQIAEDSGIEPARARPEIEHTPA